MRGGGFVETRTTDAINFLSSRTATSHREKEPSLAGATFLRVRGKAEKSRKFFEQNVALRGQVNPSIWMVQNGQHRRALKAFRLIRYIT